MSERRLTDKQTPHLTDQFRGSRLDRDLQAAIAGLKDAHAFTYSTREGLPGIRFVFTKPGEILSDEEKVEGNYYGVLSRNLIEGEWQITRLRLGRLASKGE